MNPVVIGQRLEDELRGALLAVCAMGIALVYALPYYQYRSGNNFREDLQPFVFRQFSIQAIQALESAGFRHETAALLFFALGGVAFLFSLLCLMQIVHGSYSEFSALVMLAGFMLLFINEAMPYDVWTAFFFTVALTLLARSRFIPYLWVFFLSSLNRETTILLLPVFMVHYWKRLSWRRYWPLVIIQAVAFVTVQAAIRFAFHNTPGSSIWITPAENLANHWHNPIPTLLSLAVIGVLLWLVFRQWKLKPPLLRTAFVVLAPVLAVLYIVAGQAFEFRVFAEVYPVAALLAIPQRFLA